MFGEQIPKSEAPEGSKYFFSYQGAEVTVCPKNRDGAEAVAVSIKIPENHKFPKSPRGTKLEIGERFEEAEPIASFDGALNSIEWPQTLAHADKLKIEKSSWKVLNYPQPILHIVATAIAHETLINEAIDEAMLFVEIRTGRPWSKHEKPMKAHFDGKGEKDMSFYILSSPPTTIQFLGRNNKSLTKDGSIIDQQEDVPVHTWAKKSHVKRNITAHSIMPWTLYHATGRNLHSGPWTWTREYENDGTVPEDRFFIRISFLPLGQVKFSK